MAVWDQEELFTSGDDYFREMLQVISQAQISIEMESYIFEKGLLGDRLTKALSTASQRGVQVRLIVDGWGSPNFIYDYFPVLKSSGVHVKFYRATPWLLRRLPGDPDSLIRRIILRWKRLNRGNHRKFCLIDNQQLWVGSFNVSDKHLSEVEGEAAWKDVGVRVSGQDVKYARRAFFRAYRGWRALNFPIRNPHLLLLNDSFLHMRKTRVEHFRQLRTAKQRIWLATPYFVPIGKLYRLLVRQARRGLDVRLMVPEKNDVWIMKWLSLPLLSSLARKKVKIYVYRPRFAHQKVFVADDWICVGSTNLNHRSFLHDLEMDVVITRPENKELILENYRHDIQLSQNFDNSQWAHLPFWKRILASFSLLLKYWS